MQVFVPDFLRLALAVFMAGLAVSLLNREEMAFYDSDTSALVRHSYKVAFVLLVVFVLIQTGQMPPLEIPAALFR